MFSELLAENLLEDIQQFFTNFDGTESASISTMLWIAVALTVAFLVCKLAVPAERQGLVNKIFAFTVLAYAVTAIVLFTLIYFLEDVGEKKYFVPITYYPLLVFALVTAASAVALILKPLKAVKITAFLSVGGAFAAVIVCLVVYYVTGNAEKWNYIDLNIGQNIGLYAGAAALIAAIAVVALLTDKNKTPFDSRSLSFAAVCIALSFALSYIAMFKMPFGGTITFASLLPLMLYSYMFGAKKGVIAGVVYGMLQAVQDPWILHPAQFLLDYPVAFAGIGLSGMLRSLNVLNDKPRLQFSLGALIGGAARFVSHFISGALAFGSYGAQYAETYGMPALANEYVYSLLYQTMYIIPDLIIVIIAGVLLFSSKNFKTQVDKYSPLTPKAAAQENS